MVIAPSLPFTTGHVHQMWRPKIDALFLKHLPSADGYQSDPIVQNIEVDFQTPLSKCEYGMCLHVNTQHVSPSQ